MNASFRPNLTIIDAQIPRHKARNAVVFVLDTVCPVHSIHKIQVCKLIILDEAKKRQGEISPVVLIIQLLLTYFR